MLAWYRASRAGLFSRGSVTLDVATFNDPETIVLSLLRMVTRRGTHAPRARYLPFHPTVADMLTDSEGASTGAARRACGPSSPEAARRRAALRRGAAFDAVVRVTKKWDAHPAPQALAAVVTPAASAANNSETERRSARTNTYRFAIGAPRIVARGSLTK